MTTLTDRPRTALLVVDMQRDVVAKAHDRDRVITTINDLVTRAREHEVPVFWVQHGDEEMTAGSEGWEIVNDLKPESGETVIAKSYGDSFEETDLEEVLAAAAVGHLLVTGAQTDACIRSTLHGALARGYDTTLVGDAHTTEDMRQWGSPLSPEQAINYTNMYWGFTNAPGRTCATLASTDVNFEA